MDEKRILKVAVVGNIAGGKTRLSRRLAQLHDLPLTHVDSIQFLSGLRIRPFGESVSLLKRIESNDSWLIDGYGPLDLIEARFDQADRVVFIDLPLWQHFWWAFKRQIKSLWWPRPELPAGSKEFNFLHTKKLINTLWNMHQRMRPELLKIFAQEKLRDKMIFIKNKKQWRHYFVNGLM